MTVLWILPAGTTPWGGWIYWTVIDFPAALSVGRWDPPQPFSEAYVHAGEHAFSSTWLLSMSVAALLAVFVARSGLTRRLPSWTRGATCLVVLWLTFYHSHVIAPPREFVDEVGASLVYGVVLLLTLTPRHPRLSARTPEKVNSPIAS